MKLSVVLGTYNYGTYIEGEIIETVEGKDVDRAEKKKEKTSKSSAKSIDNKNTKNSTWDITLLCTRTRLR